MINFRTKRALEEFGFINNADIEKDSIVISINPESFSDNNLEFPKKYIDDILDAILLNNNINDPDHFSVKIDDIYYEIYRDEITKPGEYRKAAGKTDIFCSVITDYKKYRELSEKRKISESPYLKRNLTDLKKELDSRNLSYSKKIKKEDAIKLLDLDDLNKLMSQKEGSKELQEELDRVKKQLEEQINQNLESQKQLDTEKIEKQKALDELNKKDKIIKSKIKENEELKKQVIDKPDIQVIQTNSDENEYIKKLKDYNLIEDIKVFDEELGEYRVQLAEYGKNNTQIFTRETDINSMIDSIGRENVLNPETTILEPTSGDGAFTVRILKYRLERIRNNSKDLNDFIIQSLKALSTIYSIEYEPDTVFIQRCNLYSTMHIEYNKYLNKDDNEYSKDWDNLVKKIIFDNVIWGSFAAKNYPEYENYNSILGFDRSSGRPLSIIKWDIKFVKNKIKYYKTIIS